jgi:hypothetical protein
MFSKGPDCGSKLTPGRDEIIREIEYMCCSMITTNRLKNTYYYTITVCVCVFFKGVRLRIQFQLEQVGS